MAKRKTENTNGDIGNLKSQLNDLRTEKKPKSVFLREKSEALAFMLEHQINMMIIKDAIKSMVGTDTTKATDLMTMSMYLRTKDIAAHLKQSRRR